ncbi:MAG: DUF6295 family protein, partial [Rhodospirillales bacterium]
MCSCDVTRIPLTGSAKGQGGWIDLSTAAVCFEHTQHACLEEALCVDLFDASMGTRIALELDAASARRLAQAILAVVVREEDESKRYERTLFADSGLVLAGPRASASCG